MASKLRDELIKASKLTPKRGESDTDFLTRVHYEVAGKISEAEWAAISGPAQDWNNAAATTIDNKQPFPPFPDETADEAAPATGRGRRGAAAAAPAAPEPFVPKLGAPVIVTTKRGKTSTGIIVEISDDASAIFINAKGEAGEKEDDEEFVLANVTIQPAPPVLNEASAQAQAAGSAEPEGPLDPEVGDTVQVVNSRDKTIVGNVIELDLEADLMVLKDATGVDHELVPSRLKSAVVKHRPAAGAGSGQPENKLGVATPPAPPAGRGRRGAAAGTAASATSQGAGGSGGADDESKVTVGTVIRDTLVDNPNATEDDCAKALTKAGITFSPVTVKVSHKAIQSAVKATIAKYVK